MDSIKDVLKQMKNTNFEQQSLELTNRILQDQAVATFLAEHPTLAGSAIRKNINRLFAYARESKHCANCPGLIACPNDVAGHTTQLRLNELTSGEVNIEDYKVACEKYVTNQSQTLLHARIKSYYMDKNIIEKGFQMAEMITCDRERAIAVDRINDYVQKAMTAGALPTKGLYLHGPLGTGKTYLLGYVLYELAKKGFSGVMIYVPDFVEEAKGWISEPGKLKEMIELLKEADLLVFDDIGAENVSPWIRDHVFATILNYRMNRKPTFFTSNYTLDGLEKHLSFSNREGEEEFKGKRLMERIRHYVDAIEVKGHNKRK